MKWLVLIAGLLGVYPFGRWLRGRPHLRPLAWTVVGFLPFFKALDIALIPGWDHLGDSYGAEVGLLDLLALSLFVAQPPTSRPLPFRAPMAAYLLAAALSMAQAPSALAAFFYVWKLLRMYLLFTVLVRAEASRQVAPSVVRGMFIGTLYEFILVFWQRFSVYGAPGSFAHQNSLGMALNLVLMVAIALILARRADWLTALVPVAGLATIVFTRSRGALIFFLLGLILVFVLSLLRGVTTRKVAVALVGVAVGVAVLGKAGQRIRERFETAPTASMETRRHFETAASMMLQENPLGVGVNQFTWALMNRGYGDRAGVDAYNMRAIVHNIYWLTAAEMGYFGIVALLALLLAPLVVAFRHSFMARGDLRADMLLGLGVGILISCLQGMVEWVWRATSVSYTFWTILALIAILARQLQDARVRGTALPAPQPRRSGRAGGVAHLVV